MVSFRGQHRPYVQATWWGTEASRQRPPEWAWSGSSRPVKHLGGYSPRLCGTFNLLGDSESECPAGPLQVSNQQELCGRTSCYFKLLRSGSYLLCSKRWLIHQESSLSNNVICAPKSTNGATFPKRMLYCCLREFSPCQWLPILQDLLWVYEQ